ncbi:MAG: twin-arginine translocase TatA/TatE family subunit [Rhodospirillaceae bacterium]|jgi:sec-independent protein translocase protein TatA|nr:twin-arginine translocase TatA/TatE family subunit [Rhodospirillaceae bacterium]|tara:strand:+ start:228 stop:476 length:249 start_codon:yes stop_codon:yes gene_type:complete
MSFGFWQIALILIIVLILFGAGKLPKVMGDVAQGVKSFKSGMRDEADEDEKPREVKHADTVHSETAEKTGSKAPVKDEAVNS